MPYNSRMRHAFIYKEPTISPTFLEASEDKTVIGF